MQAPIRLPARHPTRRCQVPITVGPRSHNGEPLPPNVVADIMAVTDGTTDSEWWAGESADGPRLSDEAVDWIEVVANDEEPTAD